MMRNKLLKFRNGARGFTLVELLVAIAIIVLLASILFPVFAKARENARRTNCSSNMKHLGLGVLQYTQDYDERMPCGLGYFDYNPGSGWIHFLTGTGWAGQIMPYVKNVEIFKCPGDSTAISGTYYPVSYAFNHGWMYPPPYGADRAIVNASEPARTIMLFEVANTTAQLGLVDEGYSTGATKMSATGKIMDCQMLSNAGGAPSADATGRPGKFATGFVDDYTTNGTCNSFSKPGGSASDLLGPRHFEGANYLLGDGHVKYYRGALVSTGDTALTTTAQQDLTDVKAEGTGYSGTGAHAVTFSVR